MTENNRMLIFLFFITTFASPFSGCDSYQYNYDVDGDGFLPSQGDCNNTDDTIHPDALEICDGIDNDCDGNVDNGADHDPSIEELPDGIDNDCDGSIDEDTILSDDDGDGFSEIEGDCDDGDASVFEDAVETLDGVDNDCDGSIDEGTDAFDDDGDGYSENEGDCDDRASTIYPSADETCSDEVDSDCDGEDEICCEVIWEHAFGGSETDRAYSVQQAHDGGFVVAGYTDAFHEETQDDIMVVKTDEDGDEEWYSITGGTRDDYSFSLAKTTSGHYILTGMTYSFDEDTSSDIFLSKIDNNGNEIWIITFGGESYDYGKSVIETSTGDYLIAGQVSLSTAVLIKTDENGNMEWEEEFSISGYGLSSGTSIVETDDGGYAFIITSSYYGYIILIKTDSSGDTLWWMGYDEEGTGRSLQKTEDGGFIIAGTSYDPGDDCLVIKTDEYGVMEWRNTYGGSGEEECYSIIQQEDGGYMVLGTTYSYGAGSKDSLLIKIDDEGSEIWLQTFGGSGIDHAYSMVETDNGEYVLAGYTTTSAAGSSDFWLIRVLCAN